MLKCSEEVACQCLEKVVEDVDGGCVEFLGLDVTQACINAADKKEVTQYIEGAASKGLGLTRQRAAKQAKAAPAVGKKRTLV